jgi:hypothetical protein
MFQKEISPRALPAHFGAMQKAGQTLAAMGGQMLRSL